MPKFNTPINLAQSQLQNAVIQPLSSNPSSPLAGQIYYNSGSNTLQLYNGAAWVAVTTGTVANATTSSVGLIELAGDFASTSTATVPVIGSVSALVNGSSSSPAVKFAASATTGLYSSATGTINLAAGGTSVFQSTSSTTTLPLAVTASSGITVTTGGLTVSAGGVSVTGTASLLTGLNVASGVLTVTSTAITVGASTTFSAGGNVINNVGSPLVATDAANKGYVDAAVQGLDVQASCFAATVGIETYTIVSGNVTQINGTLIDTLNPTVGDRILIKDAPASSGSGSALSLNPGNGIYTVTGNTTNLTLSRASDMGGTVTTNPAGYFVYVEQGTINSGSGFVVTNPNQNTSWSAYGTTPIQWTQFSGAGEITVGTGLVKSGNQISLSTPVSIANGGTSSNTASAARVNLGIPYVYTTGITSGNTSYTITPGASPTATGAWSVTLVNNTTGAVEYCDVSINQSTNVITLSFTYATTVNYTVIVIG